MTGLCSAVSAAARTPKPGRCDATLTSAIIRRGACALVLAGSILGALPSRAGGDETCGKIAELIAIDALREKLKAERLYEPWAKEQCLGFYPEHCDAEKVDVAVRELHSAECGGDPATGPVVDRFRVHRKSKKIERYNVANDEYREFGSHGPSRR